jgi:transposase
MPAQPRYPSDLTDAQWALVEPLLAPAKPGGRPEARPRREVVNAILYLVRTGRSWRQPPKDFPPRETVCWRFAAWRDGCCLDALHDHLRARVRATEGRNEAPGAAVIDAQSVKGAETAGAATRGYDAGKRTNRAKRRAVVDTAGLLLMVVVTAARVQERDGARSVTEKLRRAHPGVRVIWADGGCAGKFVAWARTVLGIAVDIVRKKEGQRGFEVLPRRWVVERTFAWITKCRRLDHDYERRVETSEAMVKWAMVGLMTRRLSPSGRRPWASVKTA